MKKLKSIIKKLQKNVKNKITFRSKFSFLYHKNTAINSVSSRPKIKLVLLIHDYFNAIYLKDDEKKLTVYEKITAITKNKNLLKLLDCESKQLQFDVAKILKIKNAKEENQAKKIQKYDQLIDKRKRNVKKVKNKKIRTALVCIAKNEDHYIEEWISYHLKLGFNKIFVYANDWNYSSQQEEVEVINVQGKYQQRRSYNNFIKKNHSKYDWAAFLDVDEFICLKKHKTIQDFILDYKIYDAIGINWVFFGDSGHKKIVENNYSTLKRFIWRGEPHHNIKGVIKLKKGIHFEFPHFPKKLIGVDTNFNYFFGQSNKNRPNDIAQINHYFVRTLEEYKSIRMERSTPIPKTKSKYEELYLERNQNKIKDTICRDFLYPDLHEKKSI